MRTDFGGGSLQSRALGLVLRNSARRVIDVWAWMPGLPWPYAVVDQLGQLQRKVPGTTFREVRVGGRRTRIVRPARPRDGRHVLYFHGGAFLVGGWHLHGSLMSRIAAATGAVLTAPDYRQGPTHPVHEAVEDGLAAYRRLLAQGVPADRIIFMGDSAGGYLTFTVADAAQAAGIPAPAGIVAMSPLVDFDLARTPVGRTRRGDHVFGPRALRTFARLFGSATTAPTPVDCDHASLPPVLVQASSSEALFRQSRRLVELLEDAGVATDFHVWSGQVHVFQAATLLPESAAAITALAAWSERTWDAEVAAATA